MDASGGLFGAFVNEPLRKREGQYYGTGESCVQFLLTGSCFTLLLDEPS